MLLRAACLTLLVASAGLTATGLRQVSELAPDLDDVEMADHLDVVLDQAMQRYSLAGAAAGAIRDGQVIWQARRGRSSASGAPVTDATAVNLGSISKPLTVWTVLRLAQAGRIDLDAPLSDYDLPYQPDYADYDPAGVTIRRLLQHTAGTNQPGYGGYGVPDDHPDEDLALSEEYAPVLIYTPTGAERS